MRKKSVVVLLSLATVVLLLLPWRRALSQQLAEVIVANLPEVQKIEGSVVVERPVPHARMIGQEALVVPPVERSRTDGLVEAGTIATAGFTAVVLTLQGEVRGTLGSAGSVGALLLPDVEPIVEAFEKDGEIQLPLEVVSPLARREVTRFAAQGHFPVGFEGYRVFLYNSTDRAVEVNLYAYLTN